MLEQLKPRRWMTDRALSSVFLQCAECGTALPAELEISMRPPPFFSSLFYFFDTRRQICSKSLSQFETLTLRSHTHTHTHTHTPKKAHSSTPPVVVGGTQIPDEICVQARTDGGVRRVCFCAEKYARRCGLGNLIFFIFVFSCRASFFSCLDPGWGVLGGNNKQWITQCAYFYSCQAFRLCRSEPDSQQRRCEYSFRNSLLAFWKKSPE